MEQFDLEQIKNLETEREKIKEAIDEINCQREAQDDAFKQELDTKQKELSKIQQAINAASVSLLEIDLSETVFPKYFKFDDLNENSAEIYKTKNISFKDDRFVVVVDKLWFSRYNETKTEFTLYKKQEPWKFDSLGKILNYIKNNLQELTEEEYNECKKKIFEMASNLM